MEKNRIIDKKTVDRILRKTNETLKKSDIKITSSENILKDQMKHLRNLNEWDSDQKNLKTPSDQSNEEEKFRKNFDDLIVSVEFEDLTVTPKYVFWGGTIDGKIQFVYKVTPEESTSGVEFNYPSKENFSVDDEDNDEIVDRVEKYYEQFYKYWRDNVIQANI